MHQPSITTCLIYLLSAVLYICFTGILGDAIYVYKNCYLYVSRELITLIIGTLSIVPPLCMNKKNKSELQKCIFHMMLPTGCLMMGASIMSVMNYHPPIFLIFPSLTMWLFMVVGPLQTSIENDGESTDQIMRDLWLGDVKGKVGSALKCTECSGNVSVSFCECAFKRFKQRTLLELYNNQNKKFE